MCMSIPRPAPLPRPRRLFLACALALAAGALLSEGVVRFLVLSDSPLAKRWGAGLRQPRLYAGRDDEDFWKLMGRFGLGPGSIPAHLAHPLLGWVSEAIDPRTLAHAGEGAVLARRPVLLYGSSFVRCMTDAGDCFEGLLRRSSRARELALLNYGVRGYGIDQVYLLMRESLPRLEASRPLVAVGVHVHEDLDRARMRLCGWPKPLLRLEAGRPVLDRAPAPSVAAFLREHPLSPRSYAWDALRHGWLAELRPEWGWRRDRIEPSELELGRAVLGAIVDDLEARGLDYFFVLFCDESRLALAGPTDAREACVLGFLQERRVPFVSTKRELREELERTGRDPSLLYGRSGVTAEHLTPYGNEVAFRAILAGLEGRFEP
jgi:hypothetical protein